jgi:hypothetical protein
MKLHANKTSLTHAMHKNNNTVDLNSIINVEYRSFICNSIHGWGRSIFCKGAVRKFAYKFVTNKILWIMCIRILKHGCCHKLCSKHPTLKFWLYIYFGTCTYTLVYFHTQRLQGDLVYLKPPCQQITLYNLIVSSNNAVLMIKSIFFFSSALQKIWTFN